MDPPGLGIVALKVNKNFIQETFRKSHTKIVLIAGTNGKLQPQK